ncbi:DEAD/DEAH box helicase [Halorussus litoreus]|uniref:DEAD/DEAH box helicase n=1 Tax=Halorussus litoreus TaxID=1710536 RepID=UPI000E26A519|nr:DEAD/DEAH box helicase [Halorussus litoreus]
MSDGAAAGSAAFAKLGEQVRAALSERGFSTPTEPQRRAIPPLARGENALVVAPTGTGKTETAMLPVLDAIAQAHAEDGPRFGFSALYITPLRALNRDMRQRLEWWGEELDLRVDVRHGDTTDYQRQKQANNPPDVLVTTPETLQAMLTGSKLRKALEDVHHVVVDEVHELASAKRGAQLTVGLERLAELAGDFQRIGLSATVGDPEEVGQFLVGAPGRDGAPGSGRAGEPGSEGDAESDSERGAPAIVEVDVGSKVEFAVREPEITEEDGRLAGELMTDESVASHVRAIREIVENHDSTLIFVNTRQTAEALGSRFKELDANIGVHHGSLSKEARIDVEDRFKTGKLDALLCTSSMELGIDVGRIDHVVQYSSPREVARLLQRVGRAGHRSEQTSHGTIITKHPDGTLEALAIARRAKDGDVEDAEIHDGSLDTVANQIVGLVMDFGDLSAMRAYRIVTRAYPFRDLGEEEFREVCRELKSNRLVWLDEGDDRLEKSSKTWQYFYANLSMIPDEQKYAVEDIASGSQVGTLDERFVVNFAEPGEVFVQRGEMWRITEVDDDEEAVKVSPIEDPGGEIPSWVGEEIPVPYDVAQEVGEMRAVAGPQFERGAPREGVAREFTDRYPTDEYTASEALDQLDKHAEAGDPVPTADRIVVEHAARTIVVNSCFGHKVNETLGRVLSSLVGQRTGSSVGLEVDPYRIELDVPPKVSGREVADVLSGTDPDHVAAIIELSLKHSDSLKFKLSQVAAKFGALRRWEGGAGGPRIDRLLAALEDTPMYDEAVREVFHDDLAVEQASEILARIQSGEIEIVTTGGHTPIGTGGISSGRELLAPENADASVIQTVRERIRDDEVILFCLHCEEYERTKPVRRVRDQPSCPECGSTRIAALNPWADEVVKAVRAPEKDDEQEKMTRRAYKAANLVQSHGKQAVIALAARGVGPQNAARIIAKLREDEDDFYRDILAQERQYARTQSFWD